jgi:hypothetical protein
MKHSSVSSKLASSDVYIQQCFKLFLDHLSVSFAQNSTPLEFEINLITLEQTRAGSRFH